MMSDIPFFFKLMLLYNHHSKLYIYDRYALFLILGAVSIYYPPALFSVCGHSLLQPQFFFFIWSHWFFFLLYMAISSCDFSFIGVSFFFFFLPQNFFMCNVCRFLYKKNNIFFACPSRYFRVIWRTTIPLLLLLLLPLIYKHWPAPLHQDFWRKKNNINFVLLYTTTLCIDHV